MIRISMNPHRGTRKHQRRAVGQNRLTMEALEHRLVLDSTVVFNEIMYNPAGDMDENLEWIELHNQLTVDMDISDWRLDAGVEFTFPDPTIVPSRGYVVIAADPAAVQSSTGLTDVLGPFSGRLANAGEELLLYNNDNRLMNSVQYEDGGEWPTAPDGSGASLAKANERTASEDVANWTHSPQVGGTPGQANFIEPGSFVHTTLLDQSASASAFVPFPLTDDLKDSWIDPAFDDSSWTSGTTGVGFHNRTNYDDLLGLDLDEPPNGQAPATMQGINSTVYIRVPFNLDVDLQQFDTLQLQMKYEDGFVAYLNGVEIASSNAPGRDGDTGTLDFRSASTDNRSSRDVNNFLPFDIIDFRDQFVQGDNVLAFHGLNQSVSDREFLLLPRIVGGTEIKPDASLQVAFNEVDAADSESFFVEIANDGDEELDLSGFVLTSTGANGFEYVLPAQTVAGGGTVVVTAEQLGSTPEDGSRLFLYTPGKESVLDGRSVTGRLRGRSPDHDGRWLYPDTATPGAENSFAFEDSVVINEIMYHAKAEPTRHAQPPVFSTMSLSPIDITWRHTKDFNFGGNDLPLDLGPDWAQTAHAVDGTDWLEGQGPLGNISSRQVEVNKEFVRPTQVPNYITTYYFETEIGLTQEQIDQFDDLALQHMVDDGAVFYVNGQEVDRFNMPDGEITAQTLATMDVRSVSREQTAAIPKELLVALPETNRISVEVHQEDTESRDIAFGLEMVGRTLTDPGSPYQPSVPSDEEWIELYNRGTAAVDLSGWKIEDAVTFEFDAGTTIAPGEYLVISNDAEVLAAKYPAINIAGQFSGTLSNHDERILLVDAAKNPADEVHYFESGKWPELADGGGSSLELRDPDADNANAAAWSASDESGKSEWQTFTFRKLSETDILERDAQFNELIFGLLAGGEFLIDDIQVIQDPDGDAKSMIQNGTFEDDAIGEEADKWRIIGTHVGTVVADPDDPNNKVLHVSVSGAHQYTHDYAETTFVDNTDIVDDEIYEFSFRAKWLAGNSQLNTRLFFTRASHTTLFEVPENLGTPGTANSTAQSNVGPTYVDFGHQPILPTDSQDVTVSVKATDPDGVADMTLWWKVDTDWNSVAMTAGTGDSYSASIPPQASGDMIQFYVEGTDSLGAKSTFPADGSDSRALYQVEDLSQSARKPNEIIETIRLIYLPEDADILFPPSTVSNQMTNELAPLTVVYDNMVFYDVGVRQIGSRFVRPNSGYKIQLGADQAFFGVHDSIRIDLDRMSEMATKLMINRASDTQSSAYDDLAYLISPRNGHSHVVQLQLARFEAVYLDEQFVDGSSGTKFELDDVVFPSNPRGGAEGPKTGTGTDQNNDIGATTRLALTQGLDPEWYRGHLLIKSQRVKDDYESMVNLAQAIHQEGDALDAATQEVMDVDLWMRQYAIRAFVGDWDTYGFRRPKNLRMYVRPEDGKIVPLFWDSDQANFIEPIYNATEPNSRLDEIRDLPGNLRLFWGHLLDLINRSFNPDYVGRWVDHYEELSGGEVTNGITWNRYVNLVEDRVAEALAQMEDPSGRNGGIARVPFEITTNGGESFQVDTSVATLSGTGWVDIRTIQLQGSDQPLQVSWPQSDTWEIQLPVGLGENALTLESYDYQGNLLTTDSITVTSTASNDVVDSIRISEINYNPNDPTAAELSAMPDLNNDDFEFIELQNIGSESVNLLGTHFTNGIDYLFPLTLLAAGERGVLVKDAAAFELRYGSGVNVLGTFEGALANGGEQLTLVDGMNNTIVDIEYSDRGLWTESADGLGATLQLIDPAGTSSERAGKYYSWSGSTELGGSPGAAPVAPHGIAISEVLVNTDDPNTSDSIELQNLSTQEVDISGWYLSDSDKQLLKYEIPAGTTIPANGFVVFNESHFNPTPDNPSDNHFALSGQGDDVWLVTSDGQGQVTGFVDDVHFGATAPGESLARVDGSRQLAPMSSATLGVENAAPRVGPVIMSEVNYQPGVPSEAALAIEAALTSDDLEFIEVTNPTSAAVSLNDWRVRGGVDYDFANGSQLGSGQSVLVLSFDPTAADNATRLAAFRAHYGISDSVAIVGGYQGQLSDTGERITLQRAVAADGETSHLLEDEVVYDNLSPWPVDAAATAQSLTRTVATAWGNAAGSWRSDVPTPGGVDFAEPVIPGDSNMDGVFDEQDLIAVEQGGKYMSGDSATFEEGDWNGDGVFDQLDIVASLQAGNFTPPGQAATNGPKSDRSLQAADSLFANLDEEFSPHTV